MLRNMVVGAFLIAISAGTCLADTMDQAVVAELQKQGYTSVKVSTTWLGRILIRARLNGGHREIVINPATGEILRDYSSNAIQVADDDNGTEPAQTPTADDTSGGEVSIAGGDTGDAGGEVLPKEVVTTKGQP